MFSFPTLTKRMVSRDILPRKPSFDITVETLEDSFHRMDEASKSFSDEESFDSSKEATVALIAGEPPSNRSFSDFLLEPSITKGRLSLPLQAECTGWLRYLILPPIMNFAMMVFTMLFWIPFLHERGIFAFLEGLFYRILDSPLFLLVVALLILLGIATDVVTEAWTFVMLQRGRRRRPRPVHLPNLVHGVIISNYKEPLEVLLATVESLAFNTLAGSTVVVLACEERDRNAVKVFHALEEAHGDAFRAFLFSTHTLAPGEVAGKSSNENAAAQELYDFIIREGLDPFQVMVTTCDADSLFDSVFLEQLEAEFWRMPGTCGIDSLRFSLQRYKYSNHLLSFPVRLQMVSAFCTIPQSTRTGICQCVGSQAFDGGQ